MNSLGSYKHVSIRVRQLVPQLTRLMAQNHSLVLSSRVTNLTGMGSLSTMDVQSRMINVTLDDDCVDMSMPFISVKFFLLAVFGSVLSIVSLLTNLLLFYMFISREPFRGHHFYLMILALLDVGSAVAFVSILSVSVIADYYKSFELLQFWATYFRFGFAMGHVILAASEFLIMLATLEKFVLSIDSLRPLRRMQLHRRGISLGAIVAAFIIRGTIFWEVTIEYIPGCQGLGSMYPALTALTESTAFNHVWRFWVRNICSVFIPFFVMVTCNAAIICKMRKQLKLRHSKCSMRLTKVGAAYVLLQPISLLIALFSRIKHHQQKSLRTTTRVMIIIVSSYLLANALNILFTTWEHFDPSSPLRYPELYSIGSDVVSVSTIFTAVIRLPVYVANNGTIRRELQCILHGLATCVWLRQPKILRDRLVSFTYQQSPFVDTSESDEVTVLPDINCVVSRQRVMSNQSRTSRPKHPRTLRSGSEVSRKFGRFEDIKVASISAKHGVVASGIGQIFMQIQDRQLDKAESV